MNHYRCKKLSLLSEFHQSECILIMLDSEREIVFCVQEIFFESLNSLLFHRNFIYKEPCIMRLLRVWMQ
jgi:hypothetical protein